MKYLNFAYISAFSLLFAYFTGSAYAQESAEPSLYNKLKYEVSLAYTQASAKDWWNKIEPYPIYLGGLPLKNKDHLQQITDLGVTWVISLVEDFELQESWWNTPVQPQDWQQNGIVVEHIPAVDFKPLKSEEIRQGVESLAQALKQGHTVYIHCKTGIGRSASIVIAYLMQYQMLPYDDAFALVQKWHPAINLKNQQQQAILDYFKVDENLPEESQPSLANEVQHNLSSYFQNANDITEDRLAQTLDSLFYYAVEGADSSEIPSSIAGWIPQVNIESTLWRRNRYLREFAGNQEQATAEAIKRNHTYFRKMQLIALGLVPFVGNPANYSMNLWYQIREICLIAALHGHDLYDPEVKVKVLSALVGARVINATVSSITKAIAKEILVAAGASVVPGIAIALPLKMAFNYFTDNAAKAAEHAQVLFAREHSLPIAEAEYQKAESTISANQDEF